MKLIVLLEPFNHIFTTPPLPYCNCNFYAAVYMKPIILLKPLNHIFIPLPLPQTYNILDTLLKLYFFNQTKGKVK